MSLLLIGIDSLDWRLLRRYQNDLPHLALLRKSMEVKMQSVFPVDSIPAWATIFTGRSPAQHGIIHSMDIFDAQQQRVALIDADRLRGKTFWDYAGHNGRRVCVLFPLLAYPAWAVNGIMVSRSIMENKAGDLVPPWVVARELDCFPAQVLDEMKVPRQMLGTSGRHPGKQNLLAYADWVRRTVQQEAEVALTLFAREKWDLFFVYFSWLDILQHFFWRFHDEKDPTHPGPNPYQHVIREAYACYDRIVGAFLERAADDCSVIVFSDHGHAMRPPVTVNLNELLRRHGYLRCSKSGPWAKVVERLKKKLLDFVHARELDHQLLRLVRVRPLARMSQKIYLSESVIDYGRSLAYLSSFAGPKSYPYGGIKVNDPANYDQTVAKILGLLGELTDETHKHLVKWVKHRRDLYSGEWLDHYPDIVFELQEGYGIYWGVHTGLFGTAYEHNLASGGHHKEAVFLGRLAGPDWELRNRQPQLEDLFPTICTLLDIIPPADLGGTSILGR